MDMATGNTPLQAFLTEALGSSKRNIAVTAPDRRTQRQAFREAMQFLRGQVRQSDGRSLWIETDSGARIKLFTTASGAYFLKPGEYDAVFTVEARVSGEGNPTDRLGRIAYETWQKQRNLATRWEYLAPHVQEQWQAVATAVVSAHEGRRSRSGQSASGATPGRTRSRRGATNEPVDR